MSVAEIHNIAPPRGQGVLEQSAPKVTPRSAVVGALEDVIFGSVSLSQI